MVDEIAPGLADKMIDALASGDKGHALLLYHRSTGSDLETAWKVVEQMLRDLGEEINPSARHAIIREVKDCLTMDRCTRYRRFIGSLALAPALLQRLGLRARGQIGKTDHLVTILVLVPGPGNDSRGTNLFQTKI